MESFSLNPMEGKTYQAKITFANGSEKTYPLPKVEKSGYVLAVNNMDSLKISVKIMQSSDLVNKGDLTLVTQQNGNIYASVKIPSTKQLASAILQKAEIPSGIVQLTLFNDAPIPVAERIVFINHKSDKIDLNIANLKPTYTKRGNVSLDVKASNQNKPIQGSFSIAVTNADIVNPDVDNESNILTSLLLTSDLVGYVEKPNHYFKDNELNTRTELDNLLLTQGWRRIDWKALMEDKNIATQYPPEKDIRISGTVTTNANKPIANGKIALISSTKGNFVTTTETDENGRFIFDEMNFGDSIKFVIQASTKEDKKNVKVKMDVVTDQIVSVNKNTGDIEVNVNTALNKYLKESDRFFDEQTSKGLLPKTTLLKTVNITQTVKKREDSAAAYSANYNGRGRADRIITAKDLENAYSLSQYIAQGRIMGVADSSGYAWNTRIGPLGAAANQGELPPVPKLAVVLDGIMLEDFSLNDIQVDDVESVEVLLGAHFTAAYGIVGKNGILVISLKRSGNRKSSTISTPGLAIYKPKGYDFPRQFYSPKYDATQNNLPDLRTTVYWNPQLATDASGNANFNFYNPDQTGKFRIVMEGIDADGHLARNVFIYEVK